MRRRRRSNNRSDIGGSDYGESRGCDVDTCKSNYTVL